MDRHSALSIGLFLTLLLGWIHGKQMESASFNKPPYSFYCKIQQPMDTFLCPEESKPFVDIQSIAVYKNVNEKYTACLESYLNELKLEMSYWFNVQCLYKDEVDLKEDSFNTYIDSLKEAIATSCFETNPTVHKVVVEYGCINTSPYNVTLTTKIPASVKPSPLLLTTVKSTVTPGTTLLGSSAIPPLPQEVTNTPSTAEKSASAPPTPEEVETRGLSPTEIFLVTFIPIILVIIITLLLIFVCSSCGCLCFAKENKQEQAFGMEQWRSRSSLQPLYLTKSNEDAQIRNGGESAQMNDYSEQRANTGRMSAELDNHLPRRSLSYPVLLSAPALADSADSVYYGNIGENMIDEDERRSESANFSEDRRPPLRPETRVFYDRRLSDRQLAVLRRPSGGRESDFFTGGLPVVQESRIYSRASFSDLPSSQIPATLDETSGEWRQSADGAPLEIGRRPSTYGGVAMPEIAEGHENEGFCSDASKESEKETSSDHLLATRLSRMSWNGVTEHDTEFSYWPPEWQSWLKSRPSCV